ncbi:MAG: hypothetical protein WBE14_23250, partial [Xanthobacteraceae bacterium]
PYPDPSHLWRMNEELLLLERKADGASILVIAILRKGTSRFTNRHTGGGSDISGAAWFWS